MKCRTGFQYNGRMLTLRKNLSCLLLILFLASVSTSSGQTTQPPLTNAEFERISLELSEDNGFFPTDNLVSNETSYLHVAPQIREITRAGQAYIGVGPEQNFTYIVHSRPSLVFVIDIRRDNLLHHLWLKELFLQSNDRAEYLSLLFGKPLGEQERPDQTADARVLLRFIEELPTDARFSEKTIRHLWKSTRDRYPRLTTERDWASFHRIAREFRTGGPQIAYEIPGRPELNFFPSWASLMVETDLEENLGNYLNHEESFQFLRTLQTENRLIPVVGNFAGGKALRGIGSTLKNRGLSVSVFYLSNVEFYLFRNATLENFLENVADLPLDSNSLLIRSYFNQLTGYRDPHPDAITGHLSVSLLQKMQRFVELGRQEPYRDYWDLVTRDYIPIPQVVTTADP